MTGWRGVWKKYVSWTFYRLVIFGYGVFNIRVKGKRCESSVAPIFVVAPHTSIFFDMVPAYLFGGHPVASAHLLKIPLLGTITKLLDPVYLDRYSSEDRNRAMNIIQERASKSITLRWKQTLFFP